MTVRVITGDCRDVLRILPDESVHCVVTSPPYFGLRDYGTAQWEGGDAACDHLAPVGGGFLAAGLGDRPEIAADKVLRRRQQFRDQCRHCGAARIDNQIGLEPSPEAYVAELVAVFREVRRVLRKDGTLWMVIGDSYASGEVGRHDHKQAAGLCAGDAIAGRSNIGIGMGAREQRKLMTGLLAKNLLGIPWRVAFALQADGWWLRQDIIWSKPNPMPESVTDRCTKAHEYLFLLSKSATYYYDANAIREPYAEISIGRYQYEKQGTAPTALQPGGDVNRRTREQGLQAPNEAGRNKRSVWEVSTQPYPDAHFATFPPALIEPCIKAGTSEKGCCAQCGAPWVRDVIADVRPNWKGDGQKHDGTYYRPNPGGGVSNDLRVKTDRGFIPSCTCNAVTVPCTVLDPFFGAGTTGLVADRLQRNCIGIDLNESYAIMARGRITDDAPLLSEVR